MHNALITGVIFRFRTQLKHADTSIEGNISSGESIGEQDCYLSSSHSASENLDSAASGNLDSAAEASSTIATPTSSVQTDRPVLYFVTGQKDGGSDLHRHHSKAAFYAKQMLSKHRDTPDVYVMTKSQFVSSDYKSTKKLPGPSIIHFMTVHMQENKNDKVTGVTVMNTLRDYEKDGVIIFPPLQLVRCCEIKPQYMSYFPTAFLPHIVIMKKDFPVLAQQSINSLKIDEQYNGSVMVKGFASCESKHVTKFNLEPCQEDTEALQEHIRKVFLDRSIQGVIVQQHDSSLSSSYKDSIEGRLRGEICVYFRFVIFANGTIGMTLYNVLIHSPVDPITKTMDAWCLKSVYDDGHEEIE